MNSKSTAALIALTGAATLLTACGSTGLFSRSRPDEFAVTRAAPLVIPPDYGLQPPQPGAPQPTQNNTAQETLRALFGGPAPRSQVETSMLNAIGRSEDGIRSNVGDPATAVVDKGTVTRDILAAPVGAGQSARAVAGAVASPATPTAG